MKIPHRVVFTLSLAMQVLVMRAQSGDSTNTERYHLGITFGYGFLWAHNPGMGNMVNDHTIGAQVSLWKQTVGNRDWERHFHLPQYGISVLAMNLGDKEQLGYGIAAIPFINFPLGERERKVKMHFYVGWGPGWVTKIFDPETNHQNTAIGSHLNGCIRLRLNAFATLNENISVEGGIELTHFSNGAAKFPNLGVNLPAIVVGIHGHVFDRQSHLKLSQGSHTEVPYINDRWSATVCLATGVGALKVASPERYGVCNVLTYFMWQQSWRHKFGGGIDLMWSGGIMQRRLNRGDDVTVLTNFQPGLKFCYELVLGKMSWPFEVGAYLYSPYLINGSVYNRFGIRYQVAKHFNVGMTLKANINVAEYWEVYAGWKF